MIKRIFTICAFIVSGLMLAQTEETVVTTTTTTTTTTITEPSVSVRKNDVMIDPFAMLAGAVSLSYEHHLNKDMGIGISTFFIVDDYIFKDGGYWYLLPHYRYYMGSKWARGFFVEGFTGIVSREYYVYNAYDYNFRRLDEKWKTNFGLGFGIGGKWQTKRNIVFEASVGLGRTIGADDENEMFAKGMFGIGYRF